MDPRRHGTLEERKKGIPRIKLYSSCRDKTNPG
jgi:hypothetical protein